MTDGRKRTSRPGLAIGGITALAVGCCGAGPVLTGLVGAVGLGAVLGGGVGLIAFVALASGVVARRRPPSCHRMSDRRSSP